MRYVKSGFWMLLWFCILSGSASAQPVAGRVLDEVSISGVPGAARMRIDFTFPVQYLRHFPSEAGDELQIHLKPIQVSPGDRAALFEREALKPRPDNPADVDEVVFEGEGFDGFRVTVYFNHPQRFKVSQGSDYRSLEVTAFGNPSSQE